MFLKRFLSDAGERPRHPPRSRSPSPVRVKRIEMKDMPDTSLSDVDSTLDDLYAPPFQPAAAAAGPSSGPGPDPDHLRDRLSRVATDINFQPALPMPEEGVVGFDELRERNERKLKLGYDSTGLPIARLSSIGGMPSPPASRPVSQNMHLSSSLPGYYDQQLQHHQQHMPGGFSGGASESEDGSSDLSQHTSATSMASERHGKAFGNVSRRRTVHRLTAGGTRRPGTYSTMAVRRSRSAGAASVASSSKTQSHHKRRVLTIQVRHPTSPGKSRLSEVYSPTEPTPVSRAMSRRFSQRAGPPVVTITEEELSELQHQKEQSDAALTASLNELSAMRRELAHLKKRHRQEQRALARERDFVGEDLDETRDELVMLREDFAEMEMAAQQDQVTATQLRRRLQKQKGAFAELQKQMVEREEAVKGLELDAADKERMLADIAAANEQLDSLQAELRAKSVQLEVAQDTDHSDTIKGMQVNALTHVVASLQLQIQALQAANDAADRSNLRLQQDLAHEKSAGAAQADAMAALQTEADARAENIAGLQTEKDEQAQKIAELENAAVEAAETAATEREEIIQKRDALEAELAAVSSELRISKSEVAALAAAGRNSASDEGPDFAARVIELTAVVETQRIAADQLQAELTSTSKQAVLQQTSLAAELDLMRTKLEASEAEKKRVETKLSAVAAESEELSAKMAALDEARAQANMQVAQLTEDKAALDIKLKSITDHAKQLRTRLSDNYADAATDFAALSHANETLEAQLGDAMAHVAQLEYQYATANAHIQSLQAELNAMTAHAAMLESEEVHYKVQIESLSDRLAKDRGKRTSGGSSTAGGSSSGRHSHHRHHHTSSSGGGGGSSGNKKATLAAGRHEELVIVRSSNRDKGSISSKKDCSARRHAHCSRSRSRSRSHSHSRSYTPQRRRRSSRTRS